MALGLSFGKKKESSTTSQQQTQQQQQQQQQQQTGSQQTATSGTQTGAETSSVDSVLNQLTNETQQTQQQQQQRQTGVTQSLSDRLLGGLESAATSLLGSLGLAGGGATQAQAAQLGGFNLDDYVANARAAAASRVRPQVESTINQMSSQTGGTPGANSMSAILANQIQGDAATTEQSAADQALMQGIQALTQGIGATTGIDASSANVLNTLLGGLTQGRTETTQTGETATTGTQGTTGTQQQAGSQLSASQTQQQTQQFSEVLTALQELLQSSGVTQTSGTASTTGSTGGGGFSIGL